MIKTEGQIPFYKFKIFEKHGELIHHGVSTRRGGVSEGYLESLNLGLDVGDSEENVRENYHRFCEEVGVDAEKIVVAHQEHTDNILIVDEKNFEGLSVLPIKGVDGFITNLKNCPLVVRFADCQGVLMLDPLKKVIGAVHSGWRGNAQNIIGKAVAKMVKIFGCDAENILVGISQSLGPCCAEFTDPIKELPEAMHKYIDGKNVDLWKCSFEQLTGEGVVSKNIEIARRCTVCENSEFFSYRGGKKKTGHMAGVICLI